MNISEYCNEPHVRWEKVELSSCFELQNGINFSSDQRGKGLLVLDVLNMFSDDLYVRTDRLYRVDIKIAEDRLLRPGDILFVRSSVKESGVGWPAIFKGHHEPVTNCGFLIRARQTSPKLEPKFLVHYLRQNSVRAQMISRAGKVAITNINQERLGSLKIPIPPLEEQKRIADILGRAEALRAKRRATLAQLDELPQSIFIDMFGDPVTNPKEWEKVGMPEVVVGKYGIKAGPFGSSLKKEEYTKSGYRIYGQEQVIAGRFDIGDYYIGERKYQQLKACAVNEGDLLVSLVGSFGKVLVVPPGIEPGIINPRLLKITPNKNLLTSDFLAALLSLPAIQAEFERMAHGGTMGILNAGLLKQLQVILPPLDLQREFSNRVKAVENYKAAHEASLAELDELFASLQYRAFRGELGMTPEITEQSFEGVKI